MKRTIIPACSFKTIVYTDYQLRDDKKKFDAFLAPFIRHTLRMALVESTAQPHIEYGHDIDMSDERTSLWIHALGAMLCERADDAFALITRDAHRIITIDSCNASDYVRQTLIKWVQDDHKWYLHFMDNEWKLMHEAHIDIQGVSIKTQCDVGCIHKVREGYEPDPLWMDMYKSVALVWINHRRLAFEHTRAESHEELDFSYDEDDNND